MIAQDAPNPLAPTAAIPQPKKALQTGALFLAVWKKGGHPIGMPPEETKKRELENHSAEDEGEEHREEEAQRTRNDERVVEDVLAYSG